MKLTLEKIWFSLVYVTLLLIPFQLDLLRIALIIIPLLSLVIFIRDKKVHRNFILLLPVLFVLMEFIWIFVNKQDITGRISKMDSQAGLFFIPLAFLVIKPDEFSNNLDRFFGFFIAGNLLASLYALSYSVIHVWQNDLTFTAVHLDRYFSLLHHHTYYSLNALLAMLLIMHIALRKRQNLQMRLGLLAIWLVLDIAIFVAASRIGLFLALVLNLIFVWKLFRVIPQYWIKYLTLGIMLTIFILSIMFSSSFPYLKEKDHNLAERIWTKNDHSIRQIIWEKAIRISMEAFPVGKGTSTFKSTLRDELVEEYQQGLLHMADPDAHNQYLESFFETGLIGFLFLLGLMGIPLWMAIKYKQLLFQAFIVVFVVIFLFESLLKRQAGVESFIFLYGILAIQLKTLFRQENPQTD